MDTLVMAVRCALLIVVTGAFAALWSGDVPDQVAVLDRPANFHFEKRDSNPAKPNKAKKSSAGECEEQTPSAAKPASGIHLNAPIPEDIVPGTYLIVDQSGRSEMRVITGHDQASSLSSPKHFSIEFGTSRWHFIKLDSSDMNRTAFTSTTESILK